MQTRELEKKLKRLMLGRMLDTLDLRLEQAQKERIGYLEFLDLLLEDEINRRANQALAQRVARARFEEIKTLSGFDLALQLEDSGCDHPGPGHMWVSRTQRIGHHLRSGRSRQVAHIAGAWTYRLPEGL